MKRICIIFFCLLPLLAFGKEKPLKFQGCWDTIKKEIFIPVTGFINDDIPTLNLNFKDIGSVCIIITNQNGKIVYRETIQTEVNPLCTIPLKDLDIEKGMVFITDGINTIYSFIELQ